MLGGRRTLAALLMVTLATLVFVVPPALVASSVDYNVAGTIRLLRDLSQHGIPPLPAWVAEVEVIGPAIYDRWQVLADGGPEAAERIQAFTTWARQQLIDAGLGFGNAIVQLIIATLTAFFLYRDGVAAQRSLIAGRPAHRRRTGAAAAAGRVRHNQRRGVWRAGDRSSPGAADPVIWGRRRSGSTSPVRPDRRSSSQSGASLQAS